MRVFALVFCAVLALSNAELYKLEGSHSDEFFPGEYGSSVNLKQPFLFGYWIFDEIFITPRGGAYFGGSWGDHGNQANFCMSGYDDIPMIAPFMATHGDYVDDVTNDGGQITVTSTMNVTSSLLKQINDEIEGSFPAFEGLNLQYASVFTWKDNQTRECHFTYQVTLASDGVFSFVIFNYDENMPTKCQTTRFIGFHNGYHKHQLPMSCVEDNAASVATSSNIRLPGRYIFRVENVGLDAWAWTYYYLQALGSWWIWTGVSLAFIVGIMFGLCCTACFACCASSSKKSSSRRRNNTNAARNSDHHTDIHIHAPPNYTPYPDEMIPPKY